MKGLVFKVDLDATFGPWNGADAGWTALSVASHMGFADIVSLLRQAGANPLLGTTLHKDVFECRCKAFHSQLLENYTLARPYQWFQLLAYFYRDP